MKRILLIVVLFILLTPLVVGVFSLVKERPLDGYFVGEKEYTLKYFTWDRWFNDKFQEAMVKQSAQKTGFRNTLIRVANHLDFSLLQKLHAEKAILGKDNYLFEEGYIIDYIGKNYLGESYIKESLHQFKIARDILLNRYNTHLLLVLEPGKAGTYPEKIPLKYRPLERTISNYESFKKNLSSSGIPHLDLQSYFTNLKTKVPYPLYPKYGVHWSTYGMWMAVDTLLKFTQSASDIDLAEIKWKGIKTTDELKDVDFDLEKTINLLYELPHETLAYPEVEIDTTGKQRPRVLTIADSYYWSIFDNKIPHLAFSNNDFWYYNTTIYPDIWGDNAKWVKNLNYMEQVKSNQVILFMVTEMNLYRAFWGFTDSILKNEMPEYKQPGWFIVSKKLLTNDLYYNKIRNYCTLYHRPFDKILSELSNFIFHAELFPSNECYKWFWILNFENKLWQSEQQLKGLKDRAKKDNISVRKIVYNNAYWLYLRDLNSKTLFFN